MLHNYGLKISGNASLTEDCLQDFFVYLHENRQNLGEVNHVKSYLFVSFRRAILKCLKRERVFTDYDMTFDTVSNFEFSPEEIAIEQEFTSLRTAGISGILNKLSIREREAIYLKYYSDLKVSEISEVMDISYQSVLNTLQKALTRLRKDLESEVIMNVLRN